MSDLPDGVIYDDLTEAYIVDLGDDTVAEVMGRRRAQKAIELSKVLATNARLEAQLAEAREQSSDARLVATLLMRDRKREGGGNLGHMNAALRLIGFMGDYIDWCVAGKPLPEMERGRLVG